MAGLGSPSCRLRRRGERTRSRRSSAGGVRDPRGRRPGAEALQLAAEQPGLIILDVKLPDMSGFEVCRRIKCDPATSAIPVLHISTTFVDIEDRVHGLESGRRLPDRFLEPLELIATVKALLRVGGPRRPPRSRPASGRPPRRHQCGVILLDRTAGSSRSTGRWRDPGPALGRAPRPDLPRAPGQSPEPEASPFRRRLETPGIREARDLSLEDPGSASASTPIREARAPSRGACIVSDITDRSAWRRSCAPAPRSCAGPTAARTSSSPCSPTSCATPSPPSATPSSHPRLEPDDAERRAGRCEDRRAAGQAPRPADRRPARRLADHPRARSSSGRSRSDLPAVVDARRRDRPAAHRGARPRADRLARRPGRCGSRPTRPGSSRSSSTC